MKNFQVFLGLAVLALVLWAAATPVKADETFLVGGWSLGGGCCNGVDLEPCQDGPTGPIGCIVGNSTWVCVVSSWTGDFCDPQGTDPCDYSGLNSCPGSNTLCN